MRDFLDQVETAATEGRLYYLALAGALAIPDMCGALESDDGQATGARFKTWFDTHVSPRWTYGGDPTFLTGENCYLFRCSFLHQGTTQHGRSEYQRIMFIEPGAIGGSLHMSKADDALVIDVSVFCREVVASARSWLDVVEGTEPFEANLNAFIRRYPDGIHPYVVGVPIIG